MKLVLNSTALLVCIKASKVAEIRTEHIEKQKESPSTVLTYELKMFRAVQSVLLSLKQ